jgi:hypothetical protein
MGGFSTLTEQPTNLNATTPAAPSGSVNVVPQADSPTPPPTTVVRNISAYVPPPTTSSPGCVPVLPNDATKCLDGTGAFSSKSGLTLQTNGTPNGSQSKLNLVAGSDVTLTDDGSGDITIAASGGGSGATSLFTKTYFTSSSRALGTVYQNTTGKPIIVMGSVSQSGSNILTAYCDSSSSPTTVVNEQLCSFGSGSGLVFLFLVPNNYYYKVAASGASWITWVEWTILSGSVTFSGELSGSRALSTVYQNTSGNAMLVCVDVSGVGASVAVTGLSDATSTPSTVVWLSSETGASHRTIWLMVPNNHYYKVTCSGGTVAHWNEYSLPFPAAKSTDYASTPVGFRTLAYGVYPATSSYLNPGKDIFSLVSVTLSSTGNFYGSSGGGIPPTYIPVTSTQAGAIAAVPNLTCVGEYYGVFFNTGAPTLQHWWDYVLG